MSRDWGVLQNLAENGVIRIASRIELRDERNHFLGWQDGTCGEHRTVGDHRAWCYDCGEWCYPGEGGGCSGCLPDLDDFSAAASPGVVKELIEENEKLRAERDAALAVIEAARKAAQFWSVDHDGFDDVLGALTGESPVTTAALAAAVVPTTETGE